MDDAEEMTSARADGLSREQAAALTEAEIDRRWTAWLFGTYGRGLPEPVLQQVLGQAWSYGHSAGREEVESYFVELADMVARIVDLVR